ncbi:hypothetical protein GC167_08380 [bacterium]|nr:hypothetical protein [bacterium]
MLGFLLLLSVSATAYFRVQPQHYKQARYWLYRTGQSGWNRLMRGVSWKTVKTEKVKASRFRSNAYTLHRESAKALQPMLIQGEKDLETLRKKGRLVSVENDRGYRVASMNFGEPLLTPRPRPCFNDWERPFTKKAGGVILS